MKILNLVKGKNTLYVKIKKKDLSLTTRLNPFQIK